METVKFLSYSYILLCCALVGASTVPGTSQTTIPGTSSRTTNFQNISSPPEMTTVHTSATPPKVDPFLPAMATMNKIPGGMEDALLSLLIGSGSLDMTSITQLMTSLAPQLPSLLKGMLRTNESELTEAGKTCIEDIDTFMNDTMDGKLWAVSMLDASGKPGPALMKGAMKFYGDFDQCLEVESDVSRVTGRVVKGDTCVVTIKPPSQLTAIQENVPPAILVTLTLDWHLCVPDTCDGQSIKTGLQGGLSQLNISITQVVCHSEVKTGPISDDAAAIGAIVLIAVFGFLVILGTILDLQYRVIKGRKVTAALPLDSLKQPEISIGTGAMVVEAQLTNGKISNNDLVDSCKTVEQTDGKDKDGFKMTNGTSSLSSNGVDAITKVPNTERKPNVHPSPIWHRLLLCFSAVSNGEKILSVKTTPGTLTCLNGVRVLSIGWVILGHTYSFLVRIADNPVTVGDMIQSLPMQIIINGTLSVDSFFVMSGLLVTYLFLRETEKQGGVTVRQMILYYVHRYWRLTPAYAFMMFINACLVRYFTDGPTWTGPYDEKFCEDNWWLNILYVNNVVRSDAQCLGWGWYLANDMQFYYVAPLILIPLTLGTRRGYGVFMKAFGLCLIGGLIITSIATTAYYVHHTNSDILHNSMDFMYYVYMKPYCRVGTFAIGVALGYILHTTKSKIKMSTGIGWFLAFVAAGAITLSTYDEYGAGRSEWGVGGRTAHESLYRPVWGLVLGWVILMCCSGKAGVIDWMLSWAWWQPLARLSYGAFLIHPIIVNLDNIGAATKLVHYTASNLVNRFFGYTCLSYIFSFILAILVEAPLLQIEKLLLSK